MKFIICFTFLIFSFKNYCQDSIQIEKYKKEIRNKTSNQDISVVNNLNKISDEYFISNIDSSFFYANKAIEIAKKSDFKKELAYSYNRLGKCFFQRSKYNEAILNYAKSLIINNDLEDYDAVATNYFNIANAYHLLNDFPKILLNLNNASRNFEKNKNNVGIARVYNSYAILYKKQDNNKLMLDYYYKALSLLKNDSSKESIKVKEIVNFNIAIFYLNSEQFNKALKFFKTRYKSELKKGTKSNLNVERSLGKVYFKLKKYNKAIKYYNLAINKSIKNGNRSNLADCYRDFSEVYFELGDTKKAINLSQKGLNISIDIGELESVKFAYQNLSKYYLKIKNYKKAYLNERDFKIISDSMFNSKINNELTQIKLNFELEKQHESFKIKQANKDKIIKQEIKRKKLLRFGLVVSFLLFGTVFYSIYTNLKSSKKQQSIIQKSLNEKEILIKEIHHRVKNNLQIISSILELQVQKSKNKFIKETLKQGQNRIRAISLIHEQLYKTEDLTLIKINKYIKNLCQHISIVSNSNNKKIDIKIKNNNFEFNINTAVPLGLIINELITNSYKHAFITASKGEVNIQIDQLEKNEYCMTITDNGQGLQEKFDIEKSESLGLKLVTILSKQLGGDFLYEFDKGATFKIRFKDNVSV